MKQNYTLWKGAPNRERVLENLVRFVGRLPETKSWAVEIKEYRKGRSSLQNRALFGVAYLAICKSTGYNVNDLHEAFCGKFFGWVEHKIFGELKRMPFRTTTTDETGARDVIPTDRFCYFYEMVQQEAAQVGIDVPDPDPFWREKL